MINHHEDLRTAFGCFTTMTDRQDDRGRDYIWSTRVAEQPERLERNTSALAIVERQNNQRLGRPGLKDNECVNSPRLDGLGLKESTSTE